MKRTFLLFIFVLVIPITLQLISHKHVLFNEFNVTSIATGKHGQIYLIGNNDSDIGHVVTFSDSSLSDIDFTFSTPSDNDVYFEDVVVTDTTLVLYFKMDNQYYVGLLEPAVNSSSNFPKNNKASLDDEVIAMYEGASDNVFLLSNSTLYKYDIYLNSIIKSNIAGYQYKIG